MGGAFRDGRFARATAGREAGTQRRDLRRDRVPRMRLVVLPLSAFPHPVSFKPLSAGLDLLSHMFLFGLPIALAAAKAIRPREAT